MEAGKWIIIFGREWCHYIEAIISSLYRILYKQWTISDMYSYQTDKFVSHNTT